jgi:hypothetical protein
MPASSSGLLHAATLVLAVFSVLAVVDGIYIHLVRLRLHERPGSYLEHVWHTAGALLAAPGLYALFVVVSGGALLWFGIAVTVLGQVVEWLDMASEKESRAPLGGLGSFEYILHAILTATRNVAFALSLAARPSSAFSLSSPNVIGTLDEPYRTFVCCLVPGAVLIALVHLWLALRRRGFGPVTV